MALPVIDRALGMAARRVSVPRDLGSITVHGDEKGDDELAEALWNRVERLYRSGMHPGIQVCIRHDGEVVVDRAIGHARGHLPGRRFDPDRAVPMTVDTPINLFSAAKAVTAMVMHKLEEEGALTLDDRVADHLPGFERHGKGDITLRQVLTHRAGIAAMPLEAFDLDLLADADRIEQIVCDLRPTGRPGESPAYHAITGGFVMESVARRTAGRSLREILATDIKAPLGLGWLDLGVAPEHADSVALNVETGFPLGPALNAFMRRAIGRDWRPVLEMSNDPRFLTGVIPSGNVIVTARDVAAFYQCLVNDGELQGTRIFEPETIANALQAERASVEIDRRLGLPMRYSPGFMLGSDSISLFGWNHPRAFGHVGLSNLFTWADPDRDLVVALLTTGKPVIGTHLISMIQLISGIHETFPSR